MGLLDKAFSNIGLGGFFEGEDSRIESRSTLSPAQQASNEAVLKWAREALDKRPAGQAYPGQLIAETPELFNTAYGAYSSDKFASIKDSTIRDLISGRPAYDFDEAASVKNWRENFADPIMNAWRETVLPSIRESLNAPGVLYGRGTSDYIAQRGSDFFGANVAPTLYNELQYGQQREFQSIESAADRRAGALSLPYQQFLQSAGVAGAKQAQEQAPLTAAYQEYLRTDPFNYAQLLSGIGTASTVENIGFQGSEAPYISILSAAAGGAAGAAFAA